MNQPSNPPPNEQPPTLGNTLFLSGICILMGGVVFLIGIGVIPGGEADPSASARILAVGAGLVFICGGLMVIVRDLSGAKNNEEIPATAPAALRLAESVITIAIIALFALVCSAIAFGPFFAGGALPDLTQQMGSFGAAIFRTIMGAFALVFWYVVIYLVLQKLKNAAGKN